MPKIHFVGVGKMGLSMAVNLATGGNQVSVSDPSQVALEFAKEKNLEVVAFDQGVNEADVVFSSLPDDGALATVVKNLVKVAKPSTIYIDTSTVSPSISDFVASQLFLNQIDYLRCPVSGNSQMAEQAQLTSLVSGGKAAYDSVLPLLKLLGPHQFYLGDAEQARVMKLVINLMVVQSFSTLSEGFSIGKSAGLTSDDMWKVITSSAVASPILKVKSEALSKNDYAATFTVEQMKKDVGLILNQAKLTKNHAAHTAIVESELLQASSRGWGDEDYAAIMKLKA